MSRSANSQFSFADWELLRQGVVLEPSLAAIADFLDEHEEIIEAIRRDLRCGLKRPDTGRKGLTAQQVLRSLILMRVKNLGLSRATRTDCRRTDAAAVHGF